MPANLLLAPLRTIQLPEHETQTLLHHFIYHNGFCFRFLILLLKLFSNRRVYSNVCLKDSLHFQASIRASLFHKNMKQLMFRSSTKQAFYSVVSVPYIENGSTVSVIKAALTEKLSPLQSNTFNKGRK